MKKYLFSTFLLFLLGACGGNYRHEPSYHQDNWSEEAKADGNLTISNHPEGPLYTDPAIPAWKVFLFLGIFVFLCCASPAIVRYVRIKWCQWRTAASTKLKNLTKKKD